MGISLLIKGLLSSSLTNQLSMSRAGYRNLITLFRFTELQLRMFEVYLCVNINLLFNVESMNAEKPRPRYNMSGAGECSKVVRRRLQRYEAGQSTFPSTRFRKVLCVFLKQ